MDARITKQRLGNLLSYDWLKIVVAIAVAVLAICVFFTTVQTRPRRQQVFSIYAYGEVTQGEDNPDLVDRLLRDGVFSYDILKRETETFGTGQYSEVAYTARRSAAQGTVMFTTTCPVSEEDDRTVLQKLTGGESDPLSLDLDVYMQDCENYLIRFFGDEWQTGELDRMEARQCFMARNGKDKRFRSDAKKEAGVLLEEERLRKLREDYLFVRSALEEGTLDFVYTTDSQGNEHAKAFTLGKLTSLSKLFYYPEEQNGQMTAQMCLLVFRNDWDAGKAASLCTNDLRYEALSFVRFLVECYH